jgi:hypothetical protein
MASPTSVHWLSLVGSVWLQTINGPNSDFPVYSSQLKDVKGISQVQLNFLAFASDAGKLLGWLAGVAALYVPLWAVALVGAAFGLVGYGVQFLFLESPRLAYWHLFSLTALAGNGICWINTVCYLLCINNFPSDSRVAVSLATSYLGLSAKFYTTMSDTLPDLGYSSAKKYLLLNAVVPMLVTLLVVPSLRVVKPGSGKRTDVGFLAMFAITLATGDPVYDAIGTLLIGVLLIVVAVFVAIEVKALLIGQSVSEEKRAAIRAHLEARPEVLKIFNVITLQMGPDVMVATQACLGHDLPSSELVRRINVVEESLRGAFPEVRWSFFEPDDSD